MVCVENEVGKVPQRLPFWHLALFPGPINNCLPDYIFFFFLGAINYSNNFIIVVFQINYFKPIGLFFVEDIRLVTFPYLPLVFVHKYSLPGCILFQVVEEGYEFFAERQLVTIFSASNYCGEFDNAGAMMSVDETLMCSFQILKPGDRVKVHLNKSVNTAVCIAP
jgi:hypothetical protein